MTRAYPYGLQAVEKGMADFLNDDIAICLVDTGIYTFDYAHDTLADLINAGSPPQDCRIGDDQTLTNKSLTISGPLSVFDADDAVFPSVSPAGQTAEALVLYQVQSPIEDSRLIFYTTDSTGLPITTDGNDITIVWSDGELKIMAVRGPIS